jgi:hypothetical protein
MRCECENCGKVLFRVNGIYILEFGLVCFDCYEKIREVFNSDHVDCPTCKNCSRELITNFEFCSKCLINDIQLFIERRDEGCFQLDYWYQQEQLLQ